MSDITAEDREAVTDPYFVVGEMLEYFDGYNLATWAPLASLIERERREALQRGRIMGLDEAERCCEFETAPDEQAWYARDRIEAAIRKLKDQ